MTSKRELRKQLESAEYQNEQLRSQLKIQFRITDTWRDKYYEAEKYNERVLSVLEKRIETLNKLLGEGNTVIEQLERERDLANADALRYAAEVQVLRAKQRAPVYNITVSGDIDTLGRGLRNTSGNYVV